MIRQVTSEWLGKFGSVTFVYYMYLIFARYTRESRIGYTRTVANTEYEESLRYSINSQCIVGLYSVVKRVQ